MLSTLEKAASAGDKVSMKKLKRELNSTKRILNQIKGYTAKMTIPEIVAFAAILDVLSSFSFRCGDTVS